MKPYTTIEEINQEWQHIKNENIQDIDLKVLAIDNNTLIAEWLLKQNNQEFDGIYEIKFNDDLECICDITNNTRRNMNNIVHIIVELIFNQFFTAYANLDTNRRKKVAIKFLYIL